MLLAKKGIEVRLWARTLREANKLKKKGSDRFPDVTIPKEIIITHKIDEALDDVSAVILAVPSASMRENISRAAKYLTKSTIIISASKGLEIGSNKRMSEVIAEEINPRFHVNICVLSGPQLAKEIINNHPAAAVVAAEDKNTAKKAQKLLTVHQFLCFYQYRCYRGGAGRGFKKYPGARRGHRGRAGLRG